MTLAQFCTEHRMPHNRTTRSVRDRALRALAEANDLSVEEREQMDQTDYGVDVEVEEGLRIQKPKGHQRFRYEVTDPDRLADWLREKHGIDLLTDEDWRLLVETIQRLVFSVILSGDETWSIPAMKQQGVLNEERFERLAEIVRRAGLLELPSEEPDLPSPASGKKTNRPGKIPASALLSELR